MALVTKLAHSGNICSGLNHDDILRLDSNNPIERAFSKFNTKPARAEVLNNKTRLPVQFGVVLTL